MLRIGTVPFLVARPLTEGLAEDPDVELVQAPPSRLAADLLTGRLDLALASSLLAVEHPDCRLWEAGPLIASDGPVRSVLVFLRPGLSGPKAVRRLRTDPRSRTGAALAGIVLRDAHHAGFETLPAPPGGSAFAAGADAVQIIGDEALRARVDRSSWTLLDLGAEWRALTGLPFVFAGWIGRPGFDPASAATTLERAASRGLARRPALVRAGARRLGLTEGFLLRYVTQDVAYRLPAEAVRNSLAAFRARLGKAPAVTTGGAAGKPV